MVVSGELNNGREAGPDCGQGVYEILSDESEQVK